MDRIAQKGITTLLVIAFMGIFLIIMGSITSFAFEEAKYGRALLGREQALHIAESGIEYYRWFLAHNPGNLTNGSGLGGPYSYTVTDPETGTTIGNASVSVVGNAECGQTQSVDITSTGTSASSPGYPRKLSARYMQTSVAAYSSVLNTSVWAGSAFDITGIYFSNGGIRMDAVNNSYVQSPLATWDCTSAYGCSPEQTSAPGVVGSGAGSALWKWGSSVSSMNIAGMGSNLSTLKTYAQTQGGLYFPSQGNTSQSGYHLIFNSNGTVTVRQVTATIGLPNFSATNYLNNSSGWGIPGYDSSGYPPDYSVIKTEQSYGSGTYTIPAACSLIFVEDRAWIEGTVKGKVTIVAATPSTTSTSPDIYLINNINYATNDGSSGLTAIAERSVFIPLLVPDTMVIHGIFVALTGAFERIGYVANKYGCSPPEDVNCVNSSYAPYTSRTQLTVEGSIVSNLRTGTTWVDSNNNFTSGFRNRINAYDELQATNPPPFTPTATTNYNFVLWKEI